MYNPLVTIKKLQKRIFANKIKQGFNISSDYNGINHEISMLAEELGELARSHRRGNKEGVVDAVTDLTIHVLGMMEILGLDANKEIEKVLNEIEKRKYVKNSDGTYKRLK